MVILAAGWKFQQLVGNFGSWLRISAAGWYISAWSCISMLHMSFSLYFLGDAVRISSLKITALVKSGRTSQVMQWTSTWTEIPSSQPACTASLPLARPTTFSIFDIELCCFRLRRETYVCKQIFNKIKRSRCSVDALEVCR